MSQPPTGPARATKQIKILGGEQLARYAGTCTHCGGSFQADDVIQFRPYTRRRFHANCPSQPSEVGLHKPSWRAVPHVGTTITVPASARCWYGPESETR